MFLVNVGVVWSGYYGPFMVIFNVIYLKFCFALVKNLFAM
jgi:hypothetical protein